MLPHRICFLSLAECVTPTMPETSEQLDSVWEERMWSLANSITGFALAQSLVAGYAFGQPSFKQQFTGPKAAGAATLLVVVTIAQIVAVDLCARVVRAQRSNVRAKRLWKGVTVGRQLAIAFFALAPLMGICLR